MFVKKVKFTAKLLVSSSQLSQLSTIHASLLYTLETLSIFVLNFVTYAGMLLYLKYHAANFVAFIIDDHLSRVKIFSTIYTFKIMIQL